MQGAFLFSFPATEIEARAGLRAAVSHLGTIGLTDDRAGSIEIALAEAVNNIVEHACAGMTDAEIVLHCDLIGGGLRIRICDSGRPLPGNRPPPGNPADVSGPRAKLPEGGFGWFLIRQLSSGIQYERVGDCNCLTLTFDL
jgi:serine/threonine-protein kinase RsbW